MALAIGNIGAPAFRQRRGDIRDTAHRRGDGAVDEQPDEHDQAHADNGKSGRKVDRHVRGVRACLGGNLGPLARLLDQAFGLGDHVVRGDFALVLDEAHRTVEITLGARFEDMVVDLVERHGAFAHLVDVGLEIVSGHFGISVHRADQLVLAFLEAVAQLGGVLGGIGVVVAVDDDPQFLHVADEIGEAGHACKTALDMLLRDGIEFTGCEEPVDADHGNDDVDDRKGRPQLLGQPPIVQKIKHLYSSSCLGGRSRHGRAIIIIVRRVNRWSRIPGKLRVPGYLQGPPGCLSMVFADLRNSGSCAFDLTPVHAPRNDRRPGW